MKRGYVKEGYFCQIPLCGEYNTNKGNLVEWREKPGICLTICNKCFKKYIAKGIVKPWNGKTRRKN